MNDPTPTPEISQGPLPETVAPAAAGDFGAALRAAREAAGISVPTLAGRLRLHVRQIEALERSDLTALPTLIYVRGFVRSCARELRIDVAPLLEDLDRRAGVVQGAPLAPSGGGFHMARLGDGSRSIVAIALVVLVIAGIIGTLWPRRAGVPPKPVVAEAPPPSAAIPAPDAGTSPSSTAGLAAGPSAAAESPVLTGAPSSAPSVIPANNPPGAPARAPAATAAVPASTPVSRPPVKPAPPIPADARTATAPLAAAAPAPAPAAVPEPAAAADGATLILHVHASSWVEVVQANGTSVFSQICPAGSVQTVHAEPPLRIVVGNAGAVDAQYRGAAIDLNRYANANGVARFTLQ